MQWTCERCGLQRDDRRGSGCNGVKGQAHEWVETQLYEEEKRKEMWQIFLNSPDGKEWKNEFEKIKKNILETVEDVQKRYIQVLEKENYKKAIFQIENKRSEFNKKIERYNKINEKNNLLNEYDVSIGAGMLKRLMIAGVGFWVITGFGKIPLAIIFLFSVIVIPSIFIILRKISRHNKIRQNNTNLNNIKNELQKDKEELLQYENNINEVFNEINKKYRVVIENIIQKSKQMIQENNQKYEVNNGLVYNDQYMYEKDNPYDYKFRIMYIKDEEFVEDYGIE